MVYRSGYKRKIIIHMRLDPNFPALYLAELTLTGGPHRDKAIIAAGACGQITIPLVRDADVGPGSAAEVANDFSTFAQHAAHLCMLYHHPHLRPECQYRNYIAEY